MLRFVEMIKFIETNQRFTTQLYTERQELTKKPKKPEYTAHN